jgi:hypothetical protein
MTLTPNARPHAAPIRRLVVRSTRLQWRPQLTMDQTIGNPKNPLTRISYSLRARRL